MYYYKLDNEDIRDKLWFIFNVWKQFTARVFKIIANLEMNQISAMYIYFDAILLTA